MHQLRVSPLSPRLIVMSSRGRLVQEGDVSVFCIVSTVRQFLKLGAAGREPGARTHRVRYGVLQQVTSYMAKSHLTLRSGHAASCHAACAICPILDRSEQLHTWCNHNA